MYGTKEKSIWSAHYAPKYIITGHELTRNLAKIAPIFLQ